MRSLKKHTHKKKTVETHDNSLLTLKRVSSDHLPQAVVIKDVQVLIRQEVTQEWQPQAVEFSPRRFEVKDVI